MDNNVEKLLQDGLKMVELEERLEMVQLSMTAAASCCLDSTSGDSAELEVDVISVEPIRFDP